MEFGGEILANGDNKNSFTPDQIDAMIKQGKTPDQFMSSYDFDETQRDVIVFRLPTLRDIQVYDIVKTIDGFYGIVLAIQTFPYYNILANSYNFAPFSHNEVCMESVIPGKDLSLVDNLNTLGKGATCQLEICRPYNTDNARDLTFMKDFANSTKKVKCMINGYRITDVVEIHKNIHHSTQIH